VAERAAPLHGQIEATDDDEASDPLEFAEFDDDDDL
jgi:hypothetical protein